MLLVSFWGNRPDYLWLSYNDKNKSQAEHKLIRDSNILGKTFCNWDGMIILGKRLISFLTTGITLETFNRSKKYTCKRRWFRTKICIKLI